MQEIEQLCERVRDHVCLLSILALHTSLLPRPKPFMTGPRSFSGNGACGVSGPAIGSRGPSGRPITMRVNAFVEG